MVNKIKTTLIFIVSMLILISCSNYCYQGAELGAKRYNLGDVEIKECKRIHVFDKRSLIDTDEIKKLKKELMNSSDRNEIKKINNEIEILYQKQKEGLIEVFGESIGYKVTYLDKYGNEIVVRYYDDWVKIEED